MREIKFRVWDKKRKEWVHDTQHAVSILGETIVCGAFLQRPDDSFVRLQDLNDLEVMQSTGQTDNEGKEIFEGDILQGIRTKTIVQVVWEMIGYLPLIGGFFKIIGNIYDNPELLEEFVKKGEIYGE